MSQWPASRSDIHQALSSTLRGQCGGTFQEDTSTGTWDSSTRSLSAMAQMYPWVAQHHWELKTRRRVTGWGPRPGREALKSVCRGHVAERHLDAGDDWGHF